MQKIMLGIVLIDFHQREDVESLVQKLMNWSRLKCKVYLVSVGNKPKLSFETNAKVEVVFTKKNLGYGGNNNLGIQKSIQDQNSWTLLMLVC